MKLNSSNEENNSNFTSKPRMIDFNELWGELIYSSFGLLVKGVIFARNLTSGISETLNGVCGIHL